MLSPHLCLFIEFIRDLFVDHNDSMTSLRVITQPEHQLNISENFRTEGGSSVVGSLLPVLVSRVSVMFRLMFVSIYFRPKVTLNCLC